MGPKGKTTLMLTLLLGSSFFPIIALVRGADTHNLTVTLDNLQEKNHLELGQTELLNTTIRNNGNIIEYSVTFQLLINDSQKVSTSIDELAPSSTYTSSYPWNATEGVYNLTAWVSSSAVNRSDTKWVNVCHYADWPLQPSFTFSPSSSNLVTANVLITFDASNSTDPDWANITGYCWYIGLPQINTFPNTTHTFSNPGPVNVTLTIFDSDGNNGSTWQILDVTANATAAFSICNPPNCRPPLNQGPYYVNSTLTFDASASTAATNAYIVSYVWDFGDNDTATGEVANHTYSIQGNYMVILNVTDNNTLTGSTTHAFSVVVASPIADFTVSPAPPSQYYVNSNISFTASGSYDPINYTSFNPGIANYTWSFGDNNTATGQNVTNSYSSIGTYTVSLTVTNYVNQTGSVSKTMTVTSRVSLTVKDASTGNTNIYHDPGETFTVDVTVAGVVGLDYFDFTLNYPAGTPPPLLEVENIREGDFPLAARYWNDSVGQIRVGSPTGGHLGGANGTFTLATIYFNVTNPGNCTLPLSSWNLLNSLGSQIPNVSPGLVANFYTEKPVANFTMDKSTPLPNDPVTFNASRSYDPQNPSGYHYHGITHYTWDFGDGNITDTNKTTTMQHAYNTNGTYNVTLTVWNSEGGQWSTPPTSINVEVIHDVAVTSITLTAAEFSNVTHTVTLFNIAVNLTNKGNVNETFNVMVYDNNSYAAKMNISIPAHDQAQVVFCNLTHTGWNVTGLTGTYTIYANASVTETAPSDNTANTPPNQLGVPYDLDGNGRAGLYELVILAHAYNSYANWPNWNPIVDFDGNGYVGLADLVLLAQHWHPS